MRKLIMLAACGALAAAEPEFGLVKESDNGAFYRNTIPQVARLGDGKLLSVFGVSAKTGGDPRIVGTLSSDGGKTWAPPKTLIDGVKWNDGDPNILVDGNQVWVYGTRTDLPNTIRKAVTTVTHSKDNGATWSEVREIHIPRQYTPGKQHNAIKLADGTYLMGISWDQWPERGMNARTEGEMWLSSGALLSKDGFNWTLHGNITTFQPKVSPGSTNGLCEPSVAQLHDGEILMILRSGTSKHWESRSRDNGATWSDPRPSPLTGHNTPTALWRVEGGRAIVAVWNNSPLNRHPLTAAASMDGGRTWTQPRILANSKGPQVSYPGITQAADGTLVAVWQAHRDDGGRDIRYARFRLDWLTN